DNTLRYNPFFKPEWSPDTLRSFNYIRNLLVIEKSLLERIDYFKRNEEFQGVVEYDLVLRATEQAKKLFILIRSYTTPVILIFHILVLRVGKKQ
ncbi:MAG: hypothetical protein N2053_06825, partial [Chitinispirillaceae bacterium]|nr:hypothetical protein [Chitinispirillaceae bacterium]